MKSKTEVQELAASVLALIDEHSAGWDRLREILKDAMEDERILSSSGASDFLETVYELSAYGVAGSSKPAFRLLYPALVGDKLRSNRGRHSGGETMKERKESHINGLRAAVTDILKNPKTSDWNDPEIARWLMTPPNAFHVFEHRGKRQEVKEKAMTTRVAKIRADYKASI